MISILGASNKGALCCVEYAVYMQSSRLLKSLNGVFRAYVYKKYQGSPLPPSVHERNLPLQILIHGLHRRLQYIFQGYDSICVSNGLVHAPCVSDNLHILISKDDLSLSTQTVFSTLSESFANHTYSTCTKLSVGGCSTHGFFCWQKLVSMDSIDGSRW